MPSDAYAMICVLNKDIYNREDWNWVFGLGDLKGRTGVFSFARYDPSFFGESHDLDEKEVENIIQFRGIKVMWHELGHMFGLKHCTYYKCIMNGSNSSEEALRKPWFLCPIWLKKLYYTIDFDILERYKALAKSWDISNHFESAKEWYSENISYLEDLYVNLNKNEKY